jgi:hypothetical protein
MPPPRATAATPAMEMKVQATPFRPGLSPNQGPATTSTSAGWRAPMTVATATLVNFKELKNKAMSAPRKSPPGTDRAKARQVRARRPARRAMAIMAAPSQRR